MRFSTQPIDDPQKPAHLVPMLEMVDAAHTVLCGSDYPHWDFDSPEVAFKDVPRELRERIFVGNALDRYGDRLLAANCRCSVTRARMDIAISSPALCVA